MAAKDIIKFRFAPGRSGNPDGSKKRAGERRAVNAVNADCLNRIGDALFYGGPNALKDLSKDETVTGLEKLVIAVVLKAFNKGDARALELLLTRFLGKPKFHNEQPPAPVCACQKLPELSDAEIYRRHVVLHRCEINGSDKVSQAHQTLVDYYEKMAGN